MSNLQAIPAELPPTNELTPANLDGLLAYALNRGDLEESRSLFASKWWDYRFMHPGEAFFLFSSLYGQAVKEWRDRFGINIHARLRISEHPIYTTEVERFKERDGEGKMRITTSTRRVLRPPAQRTGLWRAMCSADAHGIPYDRYINIAMATALENKWARMPLPTALYSERMVVDILQRWKREEAELLRLPEDRRFFAAEFADHPWQIEQQEWLLSLIANRPRPVMALSQYVARERRIVPRLAVQRFGVEKVRDAVMRASR